MLIDFPIPIDDRLSYIIPYFNMWKSKNNNNTLPFIILICRFKRIIMTNNFINNEIKELSFKYLDNILRIPYLKKKYYKLWLIKYLGRKPSVNNLDLELNQINTNDSDVIIYIDMEERRKYLFTQKDFNKLVRTNLEHSYAYDAVPEPLPIKNPYTNKEISKNDLININNVLKDAPLVWHMFKNSRYDINVLKIIHFPYLSNVCISSFVDGLENEDIIFYLNDMFEFFKIDSYCKKCIDDAKHIRSRIVRNTLINWMCFLKLAKPFTRLDMYYLIKLYIKPCITHTIRRKILPKYQGINIQFTGGPLDPNKLYIFKAELTKEEQIKYRRKKVEHNDCVERYRKKLKRKSNIKTIE
jgi:hypothetical protein